MTDLRARYATVLLLAQINERYDTKLELSGAPGADAAGDAFLATDGDHRAGLYVAPLWDSETATAWNEKLDAAAARLSEGLDGCYLLWVPPGADLPGDQLAVSQFDERVHGVAAGLAPGDRAEVKFPVTVKMAKTREEGGYASVAGGLSRWWTRITDHVSGTYQVDSRTVHRITSDGPAREELWEMIGRLSHTIDLGQVGEFEVEEAWTLQRLPDATGAGGLVMIGAPPSVDPTDGILVRRTARKRLLAANEALAPLDVELRAAGLIGGYEYAELETAGATVKALTPSLFAGLQVVSIIADGDVRPTFLPAALPWG